MLLSLCSSWLETAPLGSGHTLVGWGPMFDLNLYMTIISQNGSG
jgi:hypothetical protein